MDFISIYIFFTDLSTLTLQTKCSRSRPLRSPITSSARKYEGGTSNLCSKNINDSFRKSSSVPILDNEGFIEPTSEHFSPFLYELDWLENRKIPITALTKEFGKHN